MYNIVTFKIAHNPLNLGVGITLGVAIMAHVPTQYQMQTWVEERLRELQELRATNW